MRITKKFEFGELHIEDNLAIGIMKEGSHIDPASNRLLLSYCNEVFEEKPFGYLSHRQNSYSVDPTVYIDAANHFGLKAIAVVSQNPVIETNVIIEKQFFNQPFETFKTVEDAKNWLSQVLI